MTEIVRSYLAKDKNAVFDIMQRNSGKEFSDDHKYYFDWLENLAERNKNKQNTSLIVESKGKVAGYLSVIPCNFKIGSQSLDTGFVFDVISDPNKRGVGIKLLRKIVYSNYLHFGAPGQRVETLWAKLAKNETDNIVVEKLIKVVSIVDPAQLLIKQGVPTIISAILASAWKLAIRLNLRIADYNSSKILCLTKESDFPDDVDELFNQFAKGFYGIALKNKAFLSWRFCESPFNYEKLFLRDSGKLVGYLVYRRGLINGRKVILIVEAIAVGQQTKYYRLMLNYVYKEALNTGVSDIQTNLSGCKAFWKILRNKGAFKKNDSCSIISNFPYFKAVDRVDGEISWFFSLADSDFEFANFKLDIA